MKAKKEEISEHIFKSRAMYNAILEERDTKTAILKEKEAGIKKLENHLNKVTQTVDDLKMQLEQLESNT